MPEKNGCFRDREAEGEDVLEREAERTKCGHERPPERGIEP